MDEPFLILRAFWDTFILSRTSHNHPKNNRKELSIYFAPFVCHFLSLSCICFLCTCHYLLGACLLANKHLTYGHFADTMHGRLFCDTIIWLTFNKSMYTLCVSTKHQSVKWCSAKSHGTIVLPFIRDMHYKTCLPPHQCCDISVKHLQASLIFSSA